MGDQCVHCRAPLLLGERFAPVEAVSNKGSTRTFIGVDTHRHDASVIIKTLSVSAISEWKELELFQRGIGVLRGLEHPGIPRHLHDGEFERGGETVYYWVQERIAGRNLQQGLEQGQRWTEAQAEALARALLEILVHLQGFSPPIIHRDIKPSNIIEREDGSGFVLIDFDLVKDTLDPEGGSTTALGTAGYAPLEQLMGQAIPASDLFGLGATLVAVLSRKAPSDLVDPGEGRIDFRGHVRVSEPFAGFIEQLLAVRAAERPPDAEAALRGLSGKEEPRSSEASEAVAALPESTDDDELVVALTEASSAERPLPDTTGTITLVPVVSEHEPKVSVPATLAKDHPAPFWVFPIRIAMFFAVLFALPLGDSIAWILAAVTWIVSSFVVRYPVQLPPGRALYKGGISNTGEPGRYWLRKRLFDTPRSISNNALTLEWRPAPTRLNAPGDRVRWLELSANLRFQPRSDEVGQFSALLKYGSWSSYPHRLAKELREEVISDMAEVLSVAALFEASRQTRVSVREQVTPALTSGLAELGLTLVAVDEVHATLGAQTDDLQTEDRVDLRAAG